MNNEDTFLEHAKKAVNIALYNSVNGMNPVDNNILFLKYMMYHDKFAEAGIYITSRNKEDKYIEIIEKDDPELLEYLEEYLQLQEQISEICKTRDLWKETIEKLNNFSDTPNDKENIIKVIKPFLAIVDGKFRETTNE
jgi:hypothetical protein